MENVIKNSAAKDLTSNDLITAKIVSMIVLGVSSFIVGIIPVKLTKLTSLKSVNGDKNLLLSLLLCFGGGVLLFTTFIHLQPEVRQGFEILQRNYSIPEIGNGVPLSELVFCFGFFFVYFVEELVHFCLDRRTVDRGLHRSLSVKGRGPQKDLTIPRVTLAKFDDGNISYISGSNKELLDFQATANFAKSGHDHHHLDESAKNSFGGFLAVLALSFHAVFEGLAVGLEGGVQKVWYLFAAIATHKLVIAFCVGVQLVTTKTKLLLIVLYMGTFAVVTPLGIGIGIILSDKDGGSVDVTSVVLQGMAAGTLLYVVFFEVLSAERGNHHSGIFQLFAIVVGFGVMFSLQFLTGHEHNHGEDNHHHHHHHDHAEVTTQKNLFE